jgi:hypothetical protein
MHEGKIVLVTSELAEEEIDKVPPQYKSQYRGVYALLAKIPTVEEQRPFPQIIQAVGPGRSRVIQPAVVEEEDLGKLRSILPDENDARHVFQALENHTAYL